MEFDRPIGATDGKESYWVRVEETGAPGSLSIHGHPISLKEFRDYIRPR
jgi:hypothetical protein